MISLIVPSYKNPEYLDFCLDTSIQTAINDREYEIVAVIDGFVDLYDDVFEKYKDVKSIKFLKLEKNHGLSHALNIGVWNSSNEIISIINEDNVMPYAWNNKLYQIYDEDIVYTINQIEPGHEVPVGFGFVQNNLGTNTEDFDLDAFINFEMDIAEDKEDKKGYLFPFVMSKKNYMIVGGFDIWYNSPHICDLDFWTKLELNNVEFKRTYKMHIYHFGQKSTKKREDDSDAERKFLEKEAMASRQYKYKWGFSPYRGENYQTIPDELGEVRGIKL